MARLARQAAPSNESDEEPSNSTPPPTQDNSVSSISPAQSMSSDKENRAAPARGQKRKSDAQAKAPGSTSAGQTSTGSNKRRRVTTSPSRASRTQLESVPENEDLDSACYDPDQNQDQRRAVRRGLRDLAQQLNDSGAEYLQSQSTGLVDTLQEASRLFRNVKNTSDATIDSRLLVTAGDLSLRKTQQLVLGDASVGVDLDDFVSKCVSYMRRSPNSGVRQHDEDDEDEDEGNPLDWDYLGRTICFPNNYRPALSGFLLGPLSVQKRIRQVSQRKGRQERIDRANATRPQELEQEDLDKQETVNLTQICKQIEKQLVKISVDGAAACDQEIGEDMDEDEAQEIMAKHHLGDDGGVPLLNFCINPHSFGQTVENIFYISFLIKEGTVGLYRDSKGFPTLHTGEALDPKEAQRQGLARNQAVLSIDFDTWQELTETFDITQSIIPNREEEAFDDGTGAWYA